MTVIYPGSFDPITNGHIDIIERCSKKFNRVIVSVLNNSSKETLFTVEERVDMIEKSLEGYDNIEVDSFSGLLIDYAKEKEAKLIVRGLRAVSDFEYEMQMALINKSLYQDLETFFFIASSKYSFLSSSVVKEVSSHGGDVKDLVPDIVEKALNEKFIKDFY
ncbi:MAG: pantetheine-phosphate adenylyltransferase [Andreesenia angusta]|nr:pantetheine-phosphate adenylyltransferase [Andreesenia angusta]